jgi:hypothetical protein
MKKVILAATAAALLVAPAFAQNAQPLNQQGAPEGQVLTPASPVDIDTIIAAANNIPTEIVGVGEFQDATKIFIIPTSEFLASGRGAELTSALQRDESEFQALRTALDANPAIVTELQRAGLTVDQVVAVDITEDGELLIFTQSA